MQLLLNVTNEITEKINEDLWGLETEILRSLKFLT